MIKINENHRAETIKAAIESIVNSYEFNKNKIKAVVCDEGSNLVRLFKQKTTIAEEDEALNKRPILDVDQETCELIVSPFIYWNRKNPFLQPGLVFSSIIWSLFLDLTFQHIILGFSPKIFF